ncbi:MAG: class II fructose-bisphosphate aldolase [Deltaproteobacteria bacterium]|nr:class II fructose-bisphosphate aldolase [Deltaproteobacteria bacterium]
MQLKKSVDELKDSVKAALTVDAGGKATITDEKKLCFEAIDILAYNAAINKDKAVAAEAKRIIRAAAKAFGSPSASIQGLYEAMGRGDCKDFTVPAINIRGLTYDTSRAVFRAAKKNDSTTVLFEIAKSEISYTDQRPEEYAACVLAAAIKEGYKAPVFIQGDHFQINAKKYGEDKKAEIDGLKKLIAEALEAEFYNIDIDASTIVDLSKPSVTEQQRPNFENTAELTAFIRNKEKEKGLSVVSIGGEIGEVGGKNSTEEELRAFMDGYKAALDKKFIGISKISVQTGTSHGGVVLPDGSIAKVKVDFDTIEKLSRVSREVYGLSGVVQHGASTLPDDAFHIFREKAAAEVHLATGFQNLTYDSASFPKALKEEIYEHLRKVHSDEKKAGETDEQFIYKTRKKGFGPFKEKMWMLPRPTIDAIGKELEDRFDLIFKKLNAVNTSAHVKKYVK